MHAASVAVVILCLWGVAMCSLFSMMLDEDKRWLLVDWLCVVGFSVAAFGALVSLAALVEGAP